MEGKEVLNQSWRFSVKRLRHYEEGEGERFSLTSGRHGSSGGQTHYRKTGWSQWVPFSPLARGGLMANFGDCWRTNNLTDDHGAKGTSTGKATWAKLRGTSYKKVSSRHHFIVRDVLPAARRSDQKKQPRAFAGRSCTSVTVKMFTLGGATNARGDPRLSTRMTTHFPNYGMAYLGNSASQQT